MTGNTESRIVQCPSCGRRNRIKNHYSDRVAVCGKCSAPLEDIPVKPEPTGKSSCLASRILLNALLVTALVIVGFGIAMTPQFIKEDFSQLSLEETKKTEVMRMQKEEGLEKRKAALEKELREINPIELRRKSTEQYNRELEGRKSYDKRFALSLREKSQLRMLSLASDSTRSFHDAIRIVAREASPQGSDIRVDESAQGIALHIDFDMSSMTSGEYGTRTKHDTIASLRKEVISLISRVTNDIFQFCRDLDLASIHVGCRHYVETELSLGPTSEENTILYKIRIDKSRILRLTSNPFLDVYSTLKYFEVEEDNFEGIKIIKSSI